MGLEPMMWYRLGQPRVVILSEAKDLQFTCRCRSFASLRTTRSPCRFSAGSFDVRVGRQTTVIKGDLSDEVARLKKRYAGDIVVHGSHALVQELVRRNLVDEYHLFVYPIVLGTGMRMFDEGTKTKLKLTDSKPFKTGVVALTYHPGT